MKEVPQHSVVVDFWQKLKLLIWRHFNLTKKELRYIYKVKYNLRVASRIFQETGIEASFLLAAM